jgi:uncharacterized membrane protein YfcA
MASWLSIGVGLGIGIVAGTLAGLFGIGGGIIIVPLLALLLKFSPSKAVGTSLAAMLLPVAILAVIKYAKVGEVDFKVAFSIGFAILVMSGIGATIGLSIGNVWVSRGFGVLLLIVGVKFLFFTS